MSDPETLYEIRPFIGNGKPQWKIYQLARWRKIFGGIHTETASVFNEIGTADTEDEALALITHMKNQRVRSS